MTVYVDDAAIAATVGRITSRWSHLIADDQAELHSFAARLGLRRAWFQDPLTKTTGVRLAPGRRAAEPPRTGTTTSPRASGCARSSSAPSR